MPTAPTYPGVYIEELPSGVKTISGVATSLTAFVGRALRGPTDEPTIINNYGDFERGFGGLWRDSSLGYAVQDFFLNGGGQAIIVRLFHGEASQARLDANGLPLIAAAPGAWGNHLRARIRIVTMAGLPERYGLAPGELFNLTVQDTKTGLTETFQNISMKDSARQVAAVLESSSTLVRVEGTPGENMPGEHSLEPGTDPETQRKKTIWTDDATSSKVVEEAQATDGDAIAQADFTGTGKEANKQGLYALEKADIFNLLCIPPYTPDENADTDLISKAAAYCEDRRAMLIVDSPTSWNDVAKASAGVVDVGTNSKNAAVFFPRLIKPDALRENQLRTFAPCGAIAGVMARTDSQRGVWKAPAGLDATLNGIPALSVPLTDDENGQLNPLGVNCLRAFPAAGRVVWGARTLQGNDQLASEWKYIPVRRLALFLEESLYRGTKWVVFEPNDEPLWAQIRLNVGAFMNNLFRQGAFQGSSAKEAYFVKCDKETTTQNDINQGIVNIIVGYAPLKPAEFVILKFQQIAGEIAT
ncbi:MAG: phage tail sheath subtilisin-like domain-containing protein [Phormidesmis sp.]